MNFIYNALLIDDSKPVTFFNKVILERSGLFKTIEISQNGLEAVELLDKGFTPDIIFLDLNMPVMNGWEFLEEYSSKMIEHCTIILLLGTPLTESDMSRLSDYHFVYGIKAKMLSAATITEIKKNILET